MFKNYRHIGLLDTGCYGLTPAIAESKKIAEQLRLNFRILPATNAYLQALVSGDWDTEKFTIVSAHSEVGSFYIRFSTLTATYFFRKAEFTVCLLIPFSPVISLIRHSSP